MEKKVAKNGNNTEEIRAKTGKDNQLGIKGGSSLSFVAIKGNLFLSFFFLKLV